MPGQVGNFLPQRSQFVSFVGSNRGGGNVQNAYQGWQQWVRPSNASMIWILAYGPGGGGGAGLTRASGAAGGGAGGGGAGGVAKLLIPAVLLPNPLWIFVASGGAGGATSGTAGTSNSLLATYVTDAPNNSSAIINCQMGNGGNPGVSSGTPSGGTGGSATIGSAFAGGLGFSSTLTGAGGTAGGFSGGGAPGDVNWYVNAIAGTCGGGGGGGVTTGNVTTAGSGFAAIAEKKFSIPGGLAGGGNPGPGYERRGVPGSALVAGWLATGGCGGGSTGASGVAGKGSNAGFGSGGGGGGSGVTFGAGGAGGPGAVLIWWW